MPLASGASVQVVRQVSAGLSDAPITFEAAVKASGGMASIGRRCGWTLQGKLRECERGARGLQASDQCWFRQRL